MNARPLIAVLIAGAVAVAVAVLSRPPSQGKPPDSPRTGTATAPAAGPREVPFENTRECRACHEDVYAEWEKSYHAMAWTDPYVQALSQGFQKPECIDCHAPLPIHVTGTGQRVSPRNRDRADGVDCLTCHLLDDGVSVAASRDVPPSGVAGACRPVKVETLPQVITCAGCHNQHETVNELEASGIGKTCSDCHMEPAPRANGRTGRSHVFPGAHDVEMHRRATKLEASLESGEIVARVTNVGAGHQIPTDARHRSYNVWVSMWDPRGNPVVVDQPIAEFRLYYRDQFRDTTQIAHGKTGVGRWRVPEGMKGRVQVKLTYALSPEDLLLGKNTEVRVTEVEVR